MAEAFAQDRDVKALFAVTALSLSMGTWSLALAAGPVDNGHELFNTWCVGCHRAVVKNDNNPNSLVNGVVAGTYTLQQRYQGSKPAALEERTDLSTAYILTVIRHGLNVMPRTRKTELSDAEAAEVAAYLTRNNQK